MFFKYLLIVLLAWVIETLCCAVAYRMYRGRRGLGIPVGKLFGRSMLVGLAFALLGLFVLAIGYFFHVDSLLLLLVLSIGLIAFGAQIINEIFELDHWPSGLGICLLRAIPALLILVPVTVLVMAL